MTDVDIRGFMSNSLLEWEGRVAAVIFTAGCNWRCPYCHGWRFVKEPEALEVIPAETIFSTLQQQKDWIDGVAITGGEPTLQPGLTELIRRLKSEGLAVKLETNGTNPGVLSLLLEEQLLDCLALDYKAPLDQRLSPVTATTEQATGTERVRESFSLAAASGIEREYHTTLCPKFIDREILAEMGEALEPGGLWILQQYELEERLDPETAGEERYDTTELEELEQIARKHHKEVLLHKGKGGASVKGEA